MGAELGRNSALAPVFYVRKPDVIFGKPLFEKSGLMRKLSVETIYKPQNGLQGQRYSPNLHINLRADGLNVANTLLIADIHSLVGQVITAKQHTEGW